jgi:hypothetical protein
MLACSGFVACFFGGLCVAAVAAVQVAGVSHGGGEGEQASKNHWAGCIVLWNQQSRIAALYLIIAVIEQANDLTWMAIHGTTDVLTNVAHVKTACPCKVSVAVGCARRRLHARAGGMRPSH